MYLSITAALSPRRPITSATCARAEWALNAEKLASLAWLDGDTYPGDELTEAGRRITFNDFHDLAAGSGIGVIYKDAQKDYDQVRWATNEISRRRSRHSRPISIRARKRSAGAGLQSAGLGALREM
jgi:alpha-mannosidase